MGEVSIRHIKERVQMPYQRSVHRMKRDLLSSSTRQPFSITPTFCCLQCSSREGQTSVWANSRTRQGNDSKAALPWLKLQYSTAGYFAHATGLCNSEGKIKQTTPQVSGPQAYIGAHMHMQPISEASCPQRSQHRMLPGDSRCEGLPLRISPN